MKFLEKIKKIIEYIKNLEFQKKIILALIVVLVIANLVLGIILFTQKNVSVVKVESLINEKTCAIMILIRKNDAKTKSMYFMQKVLLFSQI